MVFHWSLSDSKPPQVSRTLLRILAVLNCAVVWTVSTRPPTSKSSSPFSNPLVTVPNTPIKIGIILPACSIVFSRSRYLSFFSHSISFILWSAGTAKSTILQVLCSLLRIFHTNVSWWYLTGVWVTTSLLKSSVFWPISIIQSFGWSPLVLLFPSPPVLVRIFC